MADKRITEETAISALALSDVLPVVDVSDTTDHASGSSRKVTVEQLRGATAPSVLAFDGTNGCQVDHGSFWLLDAATNLGATFWWEAWVKVLGSGYLVSDGYGGAHALLWGFTGAGPFTVTGNAWNGGAVSFSGNYSFASGEWAHVVVCLVGNVIYTWVNGIGDSKTAFSGNRECPTASGCGSLYVGGSDHNNLACRLAAIRAFDRGQYTPDVISNFAPERAWITSYHNGSAMVLSDFCCDYTSAQPGVLFDFSDGAVSVTGGSKIRHPGRRLDVGDSAAAFLGGIQRPFANGAAPPSWVIDEGCPYGQGLGSTLPTEVTRTPGSVPASSLIFDSFERRNQTYAFQSAPSLGSTEGGSLGALAWTATHANPTFGILGGKARFMGSPGLANYVAEGAYVNAGTANHDVRITRGSIVKNVGLIFRVQDADNFWYAWVPSDGVGFLGRVVAGVDAGADALFDATGSDAVLRAVANGTTITIYTGDGASWTQRAQLTSQTAFQSATRVGICGPHSASYTTLMAFGTYDDFTVFAA